MSSSFGSELGHNEPILSEEFWADWNRDLTRICPWWQAHQPGGSHDFEGKCNLSQKHHNETRDLLLL